MRCHSEQDTEEVGKAVLCFLALRQHDLVPVRETRWSRLTLYFTQGWALYARVMVWKYVLTHDPLCQWYQRLEDLEKHGKQMEELAERIEQCGDDGGINAML